jgi:uncharacterized membrane protein YdjX (TVP38/TMEM64 family)
MNSRRPSIGDDVCAVDGTSAPSVGRIIAVAVAMIAAVLLVHLTPLREYLTDVDRLRGQLLSLGPWVYPLTIAGTALLLACGVPRLPLHAAGGMIFGFAPGLLLTMLGAVVGHDCVFMIVRWGGRDWVLSRWPALRRWGGAVHDQGVVAVLFARQLPAHAMIINVALALSRVTPRQFLIGTAIGLLPEAIPATLIGAGLLRPSLAGSAGHLALAAAALAVIWLAGGFAYRALRKGTVA